MTFEDYKKHLDNWAELHRNTFGAYPTAQDYSEYTALFTAMVARWQYQQQNLAT